MLPSSQTSLLSVRQNIYLDEEPAEGEWYSRAVVPIKHSRNTVYMAGSAALGCLILSGGGVALACKDKKLQIESFCVAGIFLLIAIAAIWKAFRSLRRGFEQQPLV